MTVYEIAAVTLLALTFGACGAGVDTTLPIARTLPRCDVARADLARPQFECGIGPWRVVARGTESDQVVQVRLGEKRIAEIAEHQFAIVPGDAIGLVEGLFGESSDGLALVFQTRGAHCCVWLVVAASGPDASSHRFFLGNEPGILEFSGVRDLFRRDPDDTMSVSVIDPDSGTAEASEAPRAVRVRWSARTKRFEPVVSLESPRWDVVHRAGDRSYLAVNQADPSAAVELLVAGGKPQILDWSLAPENPGIGMLTYDAGTAGTSAFYQITRRALIDRSTGALVRDLPLRIDAIGDAPPAEQPRWTWGEGYVVYVESPGEEPLRIDLRAQARQTDERSSR